MQNTNEKSPEQEIVDLPKREIKFRAWNKATPGKMIDLYKITPLALNFDQDGLFLPFDERYILMECTGIRDKNGKEIYEGDIVRCYFGGSTQGEPDVIEFINAAFWMRHRRCIMLQWTGAYGHYGSEVEVIGNIFEHPNLLV